MLADLDILPTWFEKPPIISEYTNVQIDICHDKFCKNAKNKPAVKAGLNSAQDWIRTSTPSYQHYHLKVACLPISPPGHIVKT